MASPTWARVTVATALACVMACTRGADDPSEEPVAEASIAKPPVDDEVISLCRRAAQADAMLLWAYPRGLAEVDRAASREAELCVRTLLLDGVTFTLEGFRACVARKEGQVERGEYAPTPIDKNVLPGLAPPCPRWGTLAGGAPCAIGEQCAAGACARQKDATCGTCRTGPRVGEECSRHCEVGVCDGSEIGQCRPRPPPGAACGANRPCSWGETCISSGKDVAEGRCGSAPVAGEWCSRNMPCAAGLACRKPSLSEGRGEGPDTLRRDERCVFAKPVGAPCAAEDNDCIGYCDRETNTCVREKDGGPCARSDQCDSRYCIDDRCRSLLATDEEARFAADGERCYTDASCRDWPLGAKCVRGACVAPVPDGGFCPTSDVQSFPGCMTGADCVGGGCVMRSAVQCR